MSHRDTNVITYFQFLSHYFFTQFMLVTTDDQNGICLNNSVRDTAIQNCTIFSYCEIFSSFYDY